MCGIAGILKLNGATTPEDIAAVRRMMDAQAHRGPDGEGMVTLPSSGHGRQVLPPSVVLGHRRLSIIDLSDAGAQPMLDPDTGNGIVFNGEIYNYRCLRAELEAAGHRFRSHSDTEVLLKLYAAHGQEMLARLGGMYAFAIWDETKGGLFLVGRDPFGIKPLYLADDGHTLRFASQVKALLAGGQVDTAPDPAGHVGFYLWGHVPEPYTLYRSIRALPAGASLWIDRAGRNTQRPFFNLAEEIGPSHRKDKALTADAREQLRAALLDSVRHHLIADVPVGVFLSAGLDSATVAALANENLRSLSSAHGEKVGVKGGKQLHTVTLGFQEFAGTENDEVPLAEAVARHYGTTHHTQWVRKKDFAARFDKLLDAMDQPSIDGVNSYFVSLAAKEAGLKVALSGLGGDELFAGYSDFWEIPRMVGLLRPVASIPYLGRGFRLLSAPMLKKFTSPKYAGLLEYGGDYAGAYLWARRRAALLGRAGHRAIPVAAGEQVTLRAEAEARLHKVAVLQNGRSFLWEEAPEPSPSG